jgi:TPR repeat protein
LQKQGKNMFKSFFQKKNAKLFSYSLVKAEAGNPEFQLIVADMYREGVATIVDMKKSIYWYEKASDGGNIEATYKLGVAYFRGDGVGEDLDKGIQYVEHAAKNGHSMAINTLSSMISLKGIGKRL